MMAIVRTALVLGVLLTMTACRGGCQREAATAGDPLLALLPQDAEVIVAIDFARVRATSLWRKLDELTRDAAGDRQILDQLRAATGIDPFTNIHRIVAAFPEEARRTHAFAVIFETDPIDRARLFLYLRDEARRRGGDLVERKEGERTVWASPRSDGPSGFFLDDRRFVLGAGGWTRAVADRATAQAAPSAASTSAPAGPKPELLRLAERAGRDRSLWLAAQVPAATRARLSADPRFGPDAAIMRFGAGADLGPALRADLIAELSNGADAAVLVEKVQTFVAAAKKSPDVLLLGVAPYLDAIKAEVDGPNARIRIELSAALTEELAARAVGLLRLRRPAQ